MKLKALALAAIVFVRLEADTIGIIGGFNGATPNPGYAALVASDGTLTQLSGGGFPSTAGSINSVAINSSRTGLIGGTDTSGPVGARPAYAAFVSPNGTLTQLSGGGLPANGRISSVAINSSGAGLIGGNVTSGPVYAALVASNGTLTQLSGGGLPTDGFIFSIAINSSGAGILGGRDNSGPVGADPAYAALVAPNGTLTQLLGAGLPANGQILSVAINSSGAGIIGGQSLTAPQPAYAALVSPAGTLTQLSGGGFPSTAGSILSVAINNSGLGLIGGTDTSGPVGARPAYAALVAPTGTLTQLSGGGLPANGAIRSVAINSSGAGIIGGQNATTLATYAALVSPTGTLTQLTGGGLPTNGSINSVAINNDGVGLIGGSDASVPAGIPYAALVAANGTLTQLTGGGLPANGRIQSVALSILEAVTPKAIGPNSSVFNTQLIATEALEVHLNSQNSFSAGKPKESSRFGDAGSHVLVAAAGDPVLQEYKSAQGNYTLWASPFGDYLHQSRRGSSPKMTNEVLGGLLGFDYHPSNYLVGGGLSFAFNHVHFGQHQGHGNLYQEMAFAYYSYYATNVWFNVTAWGGMYQFYNKRFAPFLPSVNSHIHGWILNPHAEVATPVTFDWFIVEPFAMADWVNNWQDSFTERGHSGFQVHMSDHYSSLLRGEAGLRFYETIRFEWGKFVLEEKASYINRSPFHNHTRLNFIGAASSFPVAANFRHVQNLGGAELRAMFLPWDNAYPYGIIDAQAEVGSSFQSYFLSLEIGKNF